MKNHATFAPSQAHRWIYCPMSLLLEEKQKGFTSEENLESEEARMGTEAHQKLSELINAYNSTENLVKIDVSDPYINYVMTNLIKEYPKDKYEIQSEVSLYYDEFMYGTCDILIYKKGDSYPYAIWDLKYGETPVPALDNSQLLMYAYLVTKIFGKIQGELLVGIFQPRTQIAVDFWTINQDVIDIFEARVQEAINYYFKKPSIHRGYPQKQTDSVCKYCPVKYTICPHTSEAMKNVNNSLVMSNDINDLCLKSEQEIFLLKNRGRIIGYLDELHSRYKKRLQLGETIKGLKLTKDREIKKWKDDEEAKRIMELNGINPYTVKLKTPSQVLKEDENKILGIESFIDVEKKGSYIVED